MIENIIKLLNKEGPLTGKELYIKTGSEVLSLWQTCKNSKEIHTVIFGKRFLRLDKQVKEYGRLSPSIMREFLTYTVLGLRQASFEINRKAELLHAGVIEISKKKFDLAREIIAAIIESLDECETIKKDICCMIGGDVVYDMAHAEPRPEISTGEVIRGSDLDIIIVTDTLPENTIKMLDNAIYKAKYYYMKNPQYKEELDYIIKNTKKVEEQLNFNNFKEMIASKILFESKFLYGSQELYDRIKGMLVERGIPEKLSILEKKAINDRSSAESILLKESANINQSESLKLFFTKEEREEIY